MANPLIPVVERQWQYVINDIQAPQGSAAATTKALFLKLKTRLTTITAKPFEIAGSCDSTAFGMDGIDRIITAADLVFTSSGVHSWIVFYQAETGMYWCWDWNSTTVAKATIVVSISPFTGGSTSARPTATGEQVLISASDWTCGSDLQQVLHVMHSLDGLQTMIFVCQDGNVKTFVVLGKAVDPVPAWTTPFFAFVGGELDAGGIYHATEWERLYRTPGLASWGPSGALSLRASTFAKEAGGSTEPLCVTSNVVDPLTGEYPRQPMALVSMTSGMTGRHGRLPDLWFCGPAVADGYFPGTTDFAVFGEYVVPWVGDEPLFT